MTDKRENEIEVRTDVCSFENLYKSILICKKGVVWKDSVSKCSTRALVTAWRLKKKLDNDTYVIMEYYKFIIYEPKQRDIISTRFIDRVFQRSLCDNYLYHALTNSFIYDNGACQKYRGTDFAKRRLKVHLQKFYRKHEDNGYVLKCDIKNYFGSTKHWVAKQAIAKRVENEWVLQHVFKIIDSYDEGDATGLGLGSQITQLVQLAVLDDLDHYIKELLKIKRYVKYMDDIVLIHGDKEYLEYCKAEIEHFLGGLKLNLNVRKTQIFPLKQGINFLGFSYKYTHTGKVLMLLTKQNITKRKRKIRKYVQLYLDGKMTVEQIEDTLLSWDAHAQKGHAYWTRKRMFMYYNKVMEEALCLSS